MKANAFNRVFNYASHIAYCFRNTREGGYGTTLKMASAYLGVNLHLFKSKNETRTLKFKDFDMDLDVYSREIAGFWEIFQEQQYLELPPPRRNRLSSWTSGPTWVSSRSSRRSSSGKG